MTSKEAFTVRYFSYDKFIKFLVDKSIWFSRARQWIDMDPQETQLLPVINKYLFGKYGSDLRRKFFQAKAEFELGLAFGCSFSTWDGRTSAYMWEEFGKNSSAPGAAVVFPKSLIEGAIGIKANLLTGVSYLNPVNYISDEKFHNGAFFQNPNELDGGMFIGSLWFKNKKFIKEQEIRALIQSRSPFDTLLQRFCEDYNITIQKGGAHRKTGEIAIAFGYQRHAQHNFGCSLTENQLDSLLFIIRNNEYEVQDWDLPNHGRNTYGINVPINFNYINQIVFSPNLLKQKKELATVIDLCRQQGVLDKVRHINSSQGATC